MQKNRWDRGCRVSQLGKAEQKPEFQSLNLAQRVQGVPARQGWTEAGVSVPEFSPLSPWPAKFRDWNSGFRTGWKLSNIGWEVTIQIGCQSFWNFILSQERTLLVNLVKVPALNSYYFTGCEEQSMPLTRRYNKHQRDYNCRQKGWPLLTVDTEGMETQRVQMKGVLPWLVRWACRVRTKDLDSALAALVGPVQNIFSSPYTISIPLSPSPSKLGRLSCRVACLLYVSLITKMSTKKGLCLKKRGIVLMPRKVFDDLLTRLQVTKAALYFRFQFSRMALITALKKNKKI